MLKHSFLFIVTMLLVSCTQLEYKYSDKETPLDCETINTELYKEALFAFEDYLLEHYVANPPNTMQQAYAFYWEIAIRDLMPAVELIDEHMISIIQALKKEKELWVKLEGKSTLNPKHPVMRCIQENIINEDSKSVLKNLLDTNSFRPDIFKTHIDYQAKNLINDKALASYFAFNNFYAKVLETDFNEIDRKTNNEAQNQN